MILAYAIILSQAVKPLETRLLNEVNVGNKRTVET